MDTSKAQQMASKAQNKVDSLKEGIVKRVTSEAFYEATDIAELANRLAAAEGALIAWFRYSEARSLNHTHEHAVGLLVNDLVRGADDTWSGRGNDTRRAHFDGYRSAFGEITRGY